MKNPLKTFETKVGILKKLRKTFVPKVWLKIFEGLNLYLKIFKGFEKLMKIIYSNNFMRIFLEMMLDKQLCSWL